MVIYKKLVTTVEKFLSRSNIDKLFDNDNSNYASKSNLFVNAFHQSENSTNTAGNNSISILDFSKPTVSNFSSTVTSSSSIVMPNHDNVGHIHSALYDEYRPLDGIQTAAILGAALIFCFLYIFIKTKCRAKGEIYKTTMAKRSQSIAVVSDARSGTTAKNLSNHSKSSAAKFLNSQRNCPSVFIAISSDERNLSEAMKKDTSVRFDKARRWLNLQNNKPRRQSTGNSGNDVQFCQLKACDFSQRRATCYMDLTTDSKKMLNKKQLNHNNVLFPENIISKTVNKSPNLTHVAHNGELSALLPRSELLESMSCVKTTLSLDLTSINSKNAHPLNVSVDNDDDNNIQGENFRDKCHNNSSLTVLTHNQGVSVKTTKAVVHFQFVNKELDADKCECE